MQAIGFVTLLAGSPQRRLGTIAGILLLQRLEYGSRGHVDPDHTLHPLRVAPGVPPLLGGGTSPPPTPPNSTVTPAMYTRRITTVDSVAPNNCPCSSLLQAATGTFTSLHVLSDCTVLTSLLPIVS